MSTAQKVKKQKEFFDPDLDPSIARFLAFCGEARKGDEHVHFTGDLASRFGAGRLRVTTYKAYYDGIVSLVQRRHGPGKYDYIAQRR